MNRTLHAWTGHVLNPDHQQHQPRGTVQHVHLQCQRLLDRLEHHYGNHPSLSGWILPWKSGHWTG